mmetsp:Transcript_33569/g.89264  ORF Transcript_33569/g.89264 Transcript_33569/m.89264 type:complete len:368 (-) Transcript_33569:231-1334(-)
MQSRRPRTGTHLCCHTGCQPTSGLWSCCWGEGHTCCWFGCCSGWAGGCWRRRPQAAPEPSEGCAPVSRIPRAATTPDGFFSSRSTGSKRPGEIHQRQRAPRSAPTSAVSQEVRVAWPAAAECEGPAPPVVSACVGPGAASGPWVGPGSRCPSTALGRPRSRGTKTCPSSRPTTGRHHRRACRNRPRSATALREGGLENHPFPAWRASTSRTDVRSPAEAAAGSSVEPRAGSSSPVGCAPSCSPSAARSEALRVAPPPSSSCSHTATSMESSTRFRQPSCSTSSKHLALGASSTHWQSAPPAKRAVSSNRCRRQGSSSATVSSNNLHSCDCFSRGGVWLKCGLSVSARKAGRGHCQHPSYRGAASCLE